MKTKYSDVKYIHLREHSIKGEVLPFGGCTVAFVQSSKYKAEDPASQVYLVARAQCSARDNFCKKIGRSIARGRLESGMFDTLISRHSKLKDVAEDVAEWATTN
jgi:hypothetical protein